MQNFFDSRASKSFMSKRFYLSFPPFCCLPKFASKTKNILVGNGQHVSVLFVILVKVDLQGCRFEIYTLVLEIHCNLDMVLGI